MSDAPILVSIADGLARLTFNRPERLNAMDFEMGALWREVTEQVVSDATVSVILLDAVGPAFCAGGDVVAMNDSGASGADVTAAARTIHAGITALAESSKPVVAAVQGAVAGGGLGLMLTADYIVASDDAVFVSRYANVGLTPDLGVSTLLPAAIGQRRALQLLLTDRVLSAREAVEWGLIAEVVPRENLDAKAREIAEGWLAGATEALGTAKRLVRTAPGRSFADNLDDEAESIGRAFDTPDASARIRAFATPKKGDTPA